MKIAFSSAFSITKFGKRGMYLYARTTMAVKYTIRYDMTLLTCAQKQTSSQLTRKCPNKRRSQLDAGSPINAGSLINAR